MYISLSLKVTQKAIHFWIAFKLTNRISECSYMKRLAEIVREVTTPTP